MGSPPSLPERNDPRSTIHDPRVFLVGAGPGNPELLTLRAVECLRRADLVLYDRLVSLQVLAYAPGAEHVCVTELAEHHAERCPRVHHVLIEAARQGKTVVRLKGGDPFVFGRGGEEAEALREAGIAFEVVPGVTAALGAAAYAGIPLTHRQHASAVALVTGHEDPAKPGTLLDWEALARFPGTLVFYMGIRRLAQIADSLLAHGKPPDTPAALVAWATLGRQRVVEAPLRDLARAGQGAGIEAPALTVVGPVVGLRKTVAWFEHRPLFGKRVLVTRPAGQNAELVKRLEELGAVTHTLPAVTIDEPADWGPVDAALARLAEYHWLVFTSVNGVHALIRRLRWTGRDLRALGPVRLAAIGPATADALRGYHLEPDLVPREYRSENLAGELREHVVGKRVLLARADRGRELLREQLGEVARVEQVAVYSQKDTEAIDPAMLDLLHREGVDYITLTSGNIARSLARLLLNINSAVATGAVQLVTISPVTSDAVRELGWPVAAEAREFTVFGVVEALIRLARGS